MDAQLDVEDAQAALSYHLMTRYGKDIVTLQCMGRGTQPGAIRQPFVFRDGDGAIWRVYADNGEIEKVE